LIHWRPDAGNFKAFLTRKAADGARAATGVDMTVLPNIKQQGAMAGMFNTWHGTMNDDSLMSSLVCPLVVSSECLIVTKFVTRTLQTAHMARCISHA
jgi:hypothetical protein